MYGRPDGIKCQSGRFMRYVQHMYYNPTEPHKKIKKILYKLLEAVYNERVRS